MSENSFTEVTTESWGKKMGGSLKKIVLGFGLILAAISLLFWNEGRTVKTKRALQEGLKNAVSISSNTINPTYEGKLIHTTGKISTALGVSDPEFAVATNALALHRNVEMYQWVEKKTSNADKKMGGSTETTTTYDYIKEWSNKHENSASFKKEIGHENPTSLPYENKEVLAEDCKLGAFDIKSSILDKLNCTSSLSLHDQTNLPASFVKSGEMLYKGKGDMTAPQVGDIRVSFEVIDPSDVSIVGQQMGNTVVNYVSKNEQKVLLATCGIETSESMFATAKKNNAVLGWVLRGVGFLLLFFGFKSILGLLESFAHVLPLLGNIIAMASSLVARILAFAIAAIVIAIAWIFFRPLLGIALLVAGIGALVFVFYKKKQNVIDQNQNVSEESK